MVEVQLLDRLSVLAQRKRWLIGLAVGTRCRTLRAALVGVEGTGLSSRAEIFAERALPVSAPMVRLFRRLRRGPRRAAADVALLAAQLAEAQALLLDEFSADVAPVWSRVLAVAVDDRGLWLRRGDLRLWCGLCDAARLAELSGLNVIDAFAARDLAQDGRGRPLVPIPHWILLHHGQKTRVLVEWGRRVRLTYLPASRDPAGASRVLHFNLGRPGGAPAEAAAVVEAVANCVLTQMPAMPRVEELVVATSGRPAAGLADALSARLGGVACLAATDLGVPQGSLKPAALALLGLLHLDQVPASSMALTAARTSRVLGRLTPGSLPNWHRLVHQMAAGRPSVVSLRSAARLDFPLAPGAEASSLRKFNLPGK